MSRETIVALASGGGRAGVAVIRLSGPQAGQALVALTGKNIPEPRKAVRRWFIDPVSQERLDEGLALWFPAPQSFTGEDVVELHGHGGRATIEALLSALCRVDGVRLAEAGEFSRRAFEAGKLDLTQAEALADLVDAETEGQRRQALRQREGGLKTVVEEWRQDLIHALALTEATIDFVEEPDVGVGPLAEAARRAEALQKTIAMHLADGRRGERLREGFHVAVIGPPNAGKSSLVNALAGREAAIVSATAGTTRDVIEVHLDLGGWPVIVADTAGLREAGEAIEAEGVRRALARAEVADLTIAVFDGATWPVLDPTTEALLTDDTMIVLNKTDLLSNPALKAGILPVSVKTGAGMMDLVTALTEAARNNLDTGAVVPFTRPRHREALQETAEALERALNAPEIELMAEDLRIAARALGRISGRVAVDDVLDAVFSRFCIGK